MPAVVLTNNETGVTLTGTFNGNGGGLTNLNYTSITNRPVIPSTTGLVATNDSRALSLTNPANSFGGAFHGNGAGLTNLNGANLLAGSVGAAQLAGGSLAAPASVGGTTIYAAANTSYVVTNTGATPIYLPAMPTLGM